MNEMIMKGNTKLGFIMIFYLFNYNFITSVKIIQLNAELLNFELREVGRNRCYLVFFFVFFAIFVLWGTETMLPEVQHFRRRVVSLGAIPLFGLENGSVSLEEQKLTSRNIAQWTEMHQNMCGFGRVFRLQRNFQKTTTTMLTVGLIV